MIDFSLSGQKYLKPLMKYPGSKYESLPHILGRLPYMDVFVDVFGGSAAVLLGRRPHKLEVYNDRFSGVVDFYRCVRDHLEPLCERLELIMHSREEWERCKETWDQPDPNTVEGLVERAARWYYIVAYGFGGIDRGWARNLKANAVISGQIQRKLPMFRTIHERLKKVQIENQDWFQCMLDYDSESTVFYLDPPYLDQDNQHYKHVVDHKVMLEWIFKMKGFVALSGYPTPLYDTYPWDECVSWPRTNNLGFKEDVTEVLWIKE